jgi:hypothetical protein
MCNMTVWKGNRVVNKQNHTFLEILFEAYEKGETEQEMTVERLVQDLSQKLKTMLIHSNT